MPKRPIKEEIKPRRRMRVHPDGKKAARDYADKFALLISACVVAVVSLVPPLILLWKVGYVSPWIAIAALVGISLAPVGIFVRYWGGCRKFMAREELIAVLRTP